METSLLFPGNVIEIQDDGSPWDDFPAWVGGSDNQATTINATGGSGYSRPVLLKQFDFSEVPAGAKILGVGVGFIWSITNHPSGSAGFIGQLVFAGDLVGDAQTLAFDPGKDLPVQVDTPSFDWGFAQFGTAFDPTKLELMVWAMNLEDNATIVVGQLGIRVEYEHGGVVRTVMCSRRRGPAERGRGRP